MPVLEDGDLIASPWVIHRGTVGLAFVTVTFVSTNVLSGKRGAMLFTGCSRGARALSRGSGFATSNSPSVAMNATKRPVLLFTILST